MKIRAMSVPTSAAGPHGLAYPVRGSGMGSQLAVERPLTPFELADTHPGLSSGLLRRHEHDARGFEDKGPAVEAPEELDL